MRLINLFTFLVLCVSQVHSMNGSEPVDPFVSVPGARPFAIKLKGDVAAECMESFQAFCKDQQIARDKAVEYKAVESFANSVIETDPHAPCGDVLSPIREWISKPANAGAAHTAGMAGENRVLTVDLDTLAETLNIRARKPVTADEITEYIAAANGQSKQYSLLRFFARTALGYHNLDGLHSWLTGANGMYASTSSGASLKCDISLMSKLISARAGRDIGGEFKRFVDEYREKEGRVLLKQDFDAFTMGSGGSGAASSGMPMDFPWETLIENGMETTKQAFPKGYDISLPLVAAKKEFFRGLSSGMDDPRYRVYGNFVSSQSRDIERAIEEDNSAFANLSMTTVKDGLILQDGKVLTTGDTVWAFSTERELRIFPSENVSLGTPHHDYLFRGNTAVVHVACAGHLKVRNGKISEINRSSGSYWPTELQLILALDYFNKIGIISKDVILNEGMHSSDCKTLSEALSIASMIELA